MILIPEDRTFRHQEFRIVDFVDDNLILSEVIFQNCVLRGPAVVALTGSFQARSCMFGVAGHDIESILWPAPASQGNMAIGCVAFVGVLFEGCRFLNVGFTGTPEVLDAIRENMRPA